MAFDLDADYDLGNRPRYICFNYERGIFEISENEFMNTYVEGFFAYDRHDVHDRWGYAKDDKWKSFPENMIPPELRTYVMVAS